MTFGSLLTTSLVLICAAAAAHADTADVIKVEAQKEAGGTYRFNVTIKSDETGWDKYADRWEILGPNGDVLATRVLHHPHENEQPFTRGLGGVAIPDGVDTVTIRAHDKVDGYGGKEVTVKLPR